MLTLYGLRSCDTCRKARRAAEKAGKKVTSIDVRETPLDHAKLSRFLNAFDDRLVNKASTTWRGLGDDERAQDPLLLLTEHPALMKRPVIEGGVLTLGWNAEIEKTHLG